MSRYEVGPLVADTERFEALAEGRVMALKPKAFDAFVEFCRQSDRVLSKQELLDTVWPGLVVTESSLFKVVQEIRRALAEVGCVSAQIESVPGRGYRLVLTEGSVPSTVAAAASANAREDQKARATSASSFGGRLRWLALVAAGLIIVAIGWLHLQKSPATPGSAKPEVPTETSPEMVEGLLRSAPADALAILDSTAPDQRDSRQHRQRGQALLRLGRLDDAIDAFEQSLAGAQAPSELESSLRLLANALMQAGRQREAVDRLQRYRSETSSLPVGLLLTLGNAHLELGANTLASDAYDEAARQARELGDTGLLQHALGNLGALRYQLGDVSGSRALFEEALSLSLAALDAPVAAALQANLGNLEQHAGDYQRAARYYAQAYQAMREHADAAQIVAVLLNFANTHMEAGNHEVANYYYERVDGWARTRGQHMLAWNAALNAALSAYRQNDFASADARLDGLLRNSSPELSPEAGGLAHALLARVRAASGNPFGALEQIAAAEQAHARAPSAQLAQQIELARGRALLGIESFAQAEAALSKVLQLAGGAQDRTRLEALQLHALALSALGRIDQAEARLKDAGRLEYQLERASEAFTFTLDAPLELPDSAPGS